ncbi:hypothetical protein GQ457_05G013460 [Hibiscus cannabinus]
MFQSGFQVSKVDAPSLQGVQRLTFYNQEYIVTNQLMQPASNTLKEMEAFLSQNPSEIITIMIEDYVYTPKRLSNLFTGAGLDKFWFPVSKMLKKMVKISKLHASGFHLSCFEGSGGRNCLPVEKRLTFANSKSASLFLMNYFMTYPVENEACQEHSTPVADMIGTCFKAARSMLPNFITVNFYMVFKDYADAILLQPASNLDNSTDMMNFEICLVLVHVGAPFGSYKNISMPSTSPMISSARSFSGFVRFSKSTSAVCYPNCFVAGFFSIPWMLFLL